MCFDMCMLLLPLELYPLIFVHFEFNVLQQRQVCKEWRHIIDTHIIPSIIFENKSYTDSMLINVGSSHAQRLFISKMSNSYMKKKDCWYSTHPGKNRTFTPFVDDRDSCRVWLTRNKFNRMNTEKCIAFTSRGTQCRNRYTETTYMCSIHHSKIPGIRNKYFC